jgi:peptide/nickel transport system permease protein
LPIRPLDLPGINVVVLYPWLLLPVVPVMLVVLAFNFFGDGLRDAADPYK